MTTRTMQVDVLDLGEVDRTQVRLVGGKGANLGELSRIAGVRVPAGFCVTTAAFRRIVAEAPAVAGLRERLAGLAAEDRDGIRERGGALRRVIEAVVVPDDLRAAIAARLSGLGAEDAYAVRSSATAEDLPDASFAGLQDSLLNVRGVEAIAAAVRRCWASLFSERAVAYRIVNGFDHRRVDMAVVVQRMVAARAAGVLFTADPVTGNRKLTAIEAVSGPGEALVGGLASADRYKVRGGRIVERAIDPGRQDAPALTDAQVLQLERLGRQIEAHFGQPQDIEWCLAEDESVDIVQSRAITTLYPIPAARDGGNRVYISVGHQQMMTDAMKPLGLSVFQSIAGHMVAAGGRLFVDPTRQLASPASRDALLDAMGRHDPLIRDALVKILERGDFLEEAPGEAAGTRGQAAGSGAQVEDVAALVAELIARSEASLAALEREIQSRTGTELFDFIRADAPQMKQSAFDPRSLGVIMAGIDASAWINEKMLAWLGERNAADVLSQSLANNVTSEMGLALMAVADVIRPFPEVIAYLQRARDEDFLAGLIGLDGGAAARDALAAYLDRYGMRCAGEIDITRDRWRERPTTLVPLILGNIKSFAPGAGARRFAAGRQAALRRAEALIERLKALPDGEEKAGEARRRIDRMRGCLGYREYPKYAIVGRLFVYKQALLREAARLVQAGVLREVADSFYLTFDELREVVATRRIDADLVRARKAEHARFERLTPPRVMTSDGEIVAGSYRREDLPAGALVGLAVSSGVVEGRARVVLDMADAELAAGDILVTTFTDPSWTPLFVIIKGLVTEVGGLMTHGAVIAREYGLPAVVGVEHATRRIRDGQRIRVHGTDGYVEILDGD